MQSVANWLKGWNSEGAPPEKPEHLVVSESLLLELDFQLHEAEERKRIREQEERKQRSGVDYGWLISNPPKGFEIPEIEKLEMEELCMKVKAEECGKIINMFRDELSNDPPLENVSKIFRSVIIYVLDLRPKEERYGAMTDRFMKSLRTLKKSSSHNKVMPVPLDSQSLGTSCQESRADDIGDLPV